MVDLESRLGPNLRDLLGHRPSGTLTDGLVLLSAWTYGERLRHRAGKKDGHKQWTAKLALQSLQFWLLFIARIAAASGTTVIVTHQVAHVVDAGFSKLLSASIFGLAGITSS